MAEEIHKLIRQRKVNNYYINFVKSLANEKLSDNHVPVPIPIQLVVFLKEVFWSSSCVFCVLFINFLILMKINFWKYKKLLKHCNTNFI